MFVTRHKLAVAAAALIFLTLAGGVFMTMRQARVAQFERERADRRFQDVRRLANAFVFEMHDAIEPLPGSTKARQLLVTRATEYLDSLAKESARDPELERELAASYEKVGDVQGLPEFANLGDTAGSVKSHHAALALRETLAAAAPDDPVTQRELAATLTHLAALMRSQRDQARALEYTRRSIAIREGLRARNPNGVGERRSVAIGYHYLGDLLALDSDWPAAAEAFQRETDLFESVLATNPSVQAERDLGIAYKKLGATLESTGDRDGALRRYRQAVGLDERRVAAAPADHATKIDLSHGFASIGHVLSESGDLDGALANYRRALSLRETAAAADAHNAWAQDTVARTHLSLGYVLQKGHRHREALAEFRQAMTMTAERYAVDRANLARAEQLAHIYTGMALSAVELGLRRDAEKWARESLALWEVRRASGPLTRQAQIGIDDATALLGRATTGR
jgi:non-specific serine/threonine protein kinase/serine/threonine-protein kinase